MERYLPGETDTTLTISQYRKKPILAEYVLTVTNPAGIERYGTLTSEPFYISELFNITSDSLALVALYDSTGGENWTKIAITGLSTSPSLPGMGSLLIVGG